MKDLCVSHVINYRSSVGAIYFADVEAAESYGCGDGQFGTRGIYGVGNAGSCGKAPDFATVKIHGYTSLAGIAAIGQSKRESAGFKS